MEFGNLLKSVLNAGTSEIPDRDEPLETADTHAVNGRPLKGPYPDHTESIYFAMGCFWWAEKLFWETPGVWVTAVGYTAGTVANPTYGEVSTDRTSHCEAVLVVYDPARISTSDLMRLFWEKHDPTQGMRQGTDVGTRFRSGIFFTNEEQQHAAMESRDLYQMELVAAGLGSITTEIKPATDFYFAEEQYQQYLHKQPERLGETRGTGIVFPVRHNA
ncbi:peptide-methionine (S)-S-oxide reductase MsrA [Amaricoccus tamworthensis]|uniref:peptide-methionine (S)-S-oxide reductase MsrA n=1 Tax=Amaricoccus tamworthensis TaxID=57002 RepID=UPI003C7CE86D